MNIHNVAAKRMAELRLAHEMGGGPRFIADIGYTTLAAWITPLQVSWLNLRSIHTALSKASYLYLRTIEARVPMKLRGKGGQSRRQVR